MRSKLLWRGARLAGAATFAIFLGGCWSTKPATSWRYEIEKNALLQGAPVPDGKGIVSSSELTSNTQIRIAPEEAAEYKRIPENLQELYSPHARPLNQAEIVEQTLAHNRDIQIQNYVYQVAEAQVPISKSIYDLLIRSRGEGSREETQGTGTFNPGGRTTKRSLDTTLSQLLPTGGRVGLEHTYNRTNQRQQPVVINFPTPSIPTDPTNPTASSAPSVTPINLNTILNPIISNALSVTATQPLLRGFGPSVTNVDIHIAQIDLKTSAAEFEAQVQNQLQQSLDLYWQLVGRVATFKVQQISYAAALDLVRVNTAKERAGTIPPNEVLQALSRAESRKQSVIVAQQAVRDTEDQLKRSILLKSESPDWEAEIMPQEALTWREIEINQDSVIVEAIGRRPEIRARELALDRRDLEMVRANDALKPELNIFGSAGVSGLDDNDHDSLSTASSGEYNRFAVGLEFSYPLQNRQARYAKRQVESNRQRSMEEYARQRDQVTFEVRQAVRQLKTAKERIEAALSDVESNEANLAAERRRYDVGISTSFQLLEFQEFLANAQASYVQAVVDYNRGMIALERARGAILDTYGIQVVSPSLNPESEKIVFPVGLN